MAMAVVKMNKFTLLTFESFKTDLLKQLQIFEGVHFKNLQEGDLSGDIDDDTLEFLLKYSDRDDVTMYESELAKIKFAAEKIKPYVVKPGGLKGMTTPPDTMTFGEFDSFTQSYDYNATYENLKKIDEELKAINAEKNKLKTDNANLKNWLALDVSTTELDQLKRVSCFLGIVNKTTPEVIRETIEGQFQSCYLEVLNSAKDETYMLCAVPEEDEDAVFMALKGIGFSKANVNLNRPPTEQVAANEARIETLDREEDKINKQVAQFAGEHKQLDIAMDCMKTELERAKASDNFLALQNVIVISGWVPEADYGKFESIVSGCCGNDYYIEMNAVEKDSAEVPIKLKNNRVISAFEGITRMYSMPRYNEVDPTPLHAPFYMWFFGIMCGDIGYGIILLIASLIVTKKLHMSKGVTNFMNFMFYLSLTTIAMGFIYGGAFGVTVFAPIKYLTEAGEMAYKPILDSNSDIVLMIGLSVVIGIFQIFFGLGVKGYSLLKEGKPFSALFDSAFWLICLISAMGWLVGAVVPDMFPNGFANICKWVFIASVVGLTLTQGRDNKTIVGKLAGGLFGVYGLSSYVGDFVSYTRLVALSLSSAYIAMAFNIMAGLMPNLFCKIVFGAVILAFGHALNLGLAVLGAYVHTCRLQYVEFFGKFYEGGGKPFKPFGLMNEKVKII